MTAVSIVSHENSTRADRDYLRWLEGVRALCAIYVLLHHIYIATTPQYAENGYALMKWLVYGQFAVVAFIVVSGFSLSLKPAANEFQLPDGAFGFYRRRIWRIVPPYWVALGLSMFSLLLVSPHLAHGANLRSVIVNALLLQDILHNNTPNGAFWSIAVEFQIYILFPLLLLFCRSFGVVASIVAMTVLTIALHIASSHSAIFEKVDHVTPQMFVAFLAGVGAARFSEKPNRICLVVAVGIAGSLGPLFLYMVATHSINWTVNLYFWNDIFFAILTANLFVILQNTSSLRRMLSFPFLYFIGSFSYSIYLTHLILILPLLSVAETRLSGLPLLLSMYAFGVPAVLIGSFVFYRLFEKPFLFIRSWPQLMSAVSSGGKRMLGASG